MAYISIDIGGTNTKYALVLDDGRIATKNYRDTVLDKDEWVEDISIVINSYDLNSRERIRGIAIGCPGLIDSKRGVVTSSCNLGWENFPIVDILREKFGLPVKLVNDANLATLGEVKCGAGKGCNNVIMLTLGTGVGGGIIIDGHIYDGIDGAGGELGHMVVDIRGKKCSCGRVGCLETIASARAFLDDIKKVMDEHSDTAMWKVCDNDMSKVDIFTPFSCSDDKYASDIIDRYVMGLGTGILNYCNIFRPELILLGGGMSNLEDKLLDRLNAFIKKYDYGYKKSPVVKLKIATLKNDAALYGGRALFGGYDED